ncbi:MAG: hypothetical protein ABI893_01040 [Polaromonas sp.]|uniref:hypothetical protein n=1 Tax=Polaromonas sp. TaxID=1869339 RepID=UPI0032660D1F
MTQVFLFLSVCGFTYGAYVVWCIGWFTDQQRDEISRKDAELREEIHAGGLRGALFRACAPLYWLVSLPVRSISAALGLAALLVFLGVLGS